MRIPTLTILSCLAMPLAVPQAAASATSSTAEVRHPEDLFIVDCLLPSRVRNLGRHAKFAAPRQVVRATAHECGLRGGEFTLDPTRNDFALQAWLAQAEGGDAEAANNVGEIYEQGVRGEPDLTQAAIWYRKAADGGSRRAQRNLAHCYESGSGVSRDAVQAIVWYRKAAGLSGATDLDLEKEVAALRSEVSRLTAEAANAKAELELNAAELSRAREALVAAERELAQAKTTLAAGVASAASAKTASAQAAAQTPAAPGTQPPAKTPAPPALTVAQRQEAVESSRKRVADLRGGAGPLSPPRFGARVVRRRGEGSRGPRPRGGDRQARAGDRVLPPRRAGHPRSLAGARPRRGARSGDRRQSDRGVGARRVHRRRATARDRRRRHVPPAACGRGQQADPVRRHRPRGAENRNGARLRRLGARIPPAAALAGAPKESGRRFHALVIAGGAYRHLAPLTTSIADGEDLAAMLRDRYGFEVSWLPNATFLAAMQRLTELASQLGPQDDLLVYFAGHGRIDAATGRGYWMPVDADPNDPSTWIPNEALAKIFGIMRAGRVLVVADSCYAGALGGLGLERTKGTTEAGSRVRSVLSSGGLAPVLDQGAERHSIFARALLTVLSLAREPLSADRLYQAVSARVAFRSAELGVVQRPEYAQIGFAGHEGGDFIFQPKS